MELTGLAVRVTGAGGDLGTGIARRFLACPEGVGRSLVIIGKGDR